MNSLGTAGVYVAGGGSFVAEFDKLFAISPRGLDRRALDASESRAAGAIVAIVTVARSLVLFALAALAEIGGAWLVWQGVREHRGLWWVAAGVIALGVYGFVATFQPEVHFGRILAAYGGVFVAGSLVWGVLVDKFRPGQWDYLGAVICLVGVAVIMYAPRR